MSAQRLLHDDAAPLSDSAIEDGSPNVSEQLSSRTLSDNLSAERTAILDSFHRDQLRWNHLDRVTLVWMLAMHAGAIAAPFFFEWRSLIIAVVLHWLTCSVGVCLAYHRCLSHGSFRLAPPVRFFVTLCGVLSGQGSPLTWVATHRVHHARSDQGGDPHSPREGFWWSHLLWLFVSRSAADRQRLYRVFAPDLVQDRMLQFFDRTYGLWLVSFAIALFAVGGWSLLLWGLCLRIVVGYHTTWLINSASHVWGYRNYETTDGSRNLWWAGLLAYGEGWHNNHHAWPREACYSHRWWELDLTWQTIRVLRLLGLATAVVQKSPFGRAREVSATD
ncbi:MAG: stearoyl-CoA desaturase (delta-9 desaturase) [Planctomycetota bacterium]|nr:MAG: stearoyl-CoA desaturase (delta-9 desaturase) [Planctomycetota bacterium]